MEQRQIFDCEDNNGKALQTLWISNLALIVFDLYHLLDGSQCFFVTYEFSYTPERPNAWITRTLPKISTSTGRYASCFPQ